MLLSQDLRGVLLKPLLKNRIYRRFREPNLVSTVVHVDQTLLIVFKLDIYAYVHGWLVVFVIVVEVEACPAPKLA